MSAVPAVVAGGSNVLIVGTGLTGSLVCCHLRALTSKLSLHIDVADMARGPGGRMSTTRHGPESTRANTGAQYLSTSSPKAAALLQAACSTTTSSPSSGSNLYPRTPCTLDRVDEPVRRTTHFTLNPDDCYTHWLPREGTNSALKQFLHRGKPNKVVFESRLRKVAASVDDAKLVPIFDTGGTASTYDVIILAMPPKDIMKFFNNDKRDAQSQADLHRQTNKGRKKVRF